MNNQDNFLLPRRMFVAIVIIVIEIVKMPVTNPDKYLSELGAREVINQQRNYRSDEKPPVPDKNGTSY